MQSYTLIKKKQKQKCIVGSYAATLKWKIPDELLKHCIRLLRTVLRHLQN